MDRGRGMEALGVAVNSGMPDVGHGTTNWLVHKWDAEQTDWVRKRSGLVAPQGADFHRLRVKPYDVSGFAGNVITNAGWQALLASATGSGTPMFTSSKGRIGAGNGTTAVAATDTTFSAAAGSTNRWFQFPAAAPTVGTGSNRTWTFAATFGSSDGNFTWSEFGIDQGTASGNTEVATLFNHALIGTSPTWGGTKTSGQTWTATATLTFS